MGAEGDIEVSVEDGVVTLKGTVDTWLYWQWVMDNAIEAGARSVRNRLEIRYRPTSKHKPRIYAP